MSSIQLPKIPYEKYFHTKYFQVTSSFANTFYKIGALDKFRKFIGKHLYRKVTVLYPGTLLKEMTPPQVIFYEICDIFEALFLQNSSRENSLKYSTNRTVDSSPKKEKELENCWKEKQRQTQKKLKHYLHQLFVSF